MNKLDNRRYNSEGTTERIKFLEETYSRKIQELEKVEQELRQLNEQKSKMLRYVEGIAHIGSWSLDPDSECFSYSEEVLKIFDYQIPKVSREIYLDDYYSFIHPDDVSIVKSIISRLSEAHRFVRIYHRIVLGENKIKFVEVRADYDYDEKGKQALIHGTIQDISELQQTKEELTVAKQKLEVKINQRTRDLQRAYLQLEKEAEEKELAQAKERQLAAIVESSSDAIISKSLDGTITSWNKGAENIYHYTEEEILGENIRTLIPEAQIEKFEAMFDEVIHGKEQKIFQTQRKTKNGNIIDVSITISPIKDSAGEVTGISAISRDITNEIKERKRFELAVEAAPNAMIMINGEGKIIMVNSQTEKMFGYERAELIDKKIEILIPDKFKKGHVKTRNAFQKNPTTRAMGMGRELFGLRKDGSLVNVEIGLNPLETKEGTFVLASIVDITDRKKFENRIRESEKRYQTLVETMNEGVLIVDNDDLIQFANDHMCQMTGYTLEELTGQKASKLLLDEEGRRFMQTIFNDRKKGKSTKYEIQLVTKSGKKIWSLTSGSPIYDNDEKIIGSVGLHTNITNRKLIEEELNAIANIPAENPNPTFRFSVHGQVLMYANPASKETLAFLDDEDHSDVRKEWLHHINDAFKSDKPLKKELIVNDKIFLCSIVPVVKNGYVNVYAVDVTAAKKAEEEIKRYSLILSKTENAVVIANNHGEIQWVNDGFLKITGYSREEMIGTHGEKLRRGRKTGLNEKHRYFKKMMDSKKSVSYEAHNYKKSGEEYWAITTLTPIVNDHGAVDGVIAIDSDITAKKKAEKEIIKAKRIAEELARSKELFLANVSHEIRTPMNAISGFTDQIAKGPLTLEQREQIKMVQKSISHLIRLINDILDFSKLQHGKVVLEEASFNVRQVLEDIASFARPMAEEKNNDLICQIHKDVPSVLCGDIHRLQQIILNILGNAVKFTESGLIKMEVSMIETKKKHVNLEIVVSDTGIGMTEDQLKKIFREFEQAEVSTARNYGGTGLGLAITKRLIELFGGSIDVRSEKDKGTEVIMALPFKLGEEANVIDIVQKKELETTFLNGMKILIVDDEPFNRKLLQSMLKDKNVELTEATNGVEAIDAVRNKDFDVVLMDVRMPELNGIEATKKIRRFKDKTKKEVIIIALSAAVTEKDKHNYLHSGMNGFVPKPFKENELITALHRALGDESDAISDAEQAYSSSGELLEIKKMETVVDFNELKELSGNDTAFYNDMLQTFIDGAYDAIANIKTSFKNQEWERIPDYAHKVCAPTRHLGAEKLYKILKKIENDGRKNNFELYTVLMDLFETEIGKVIQIVESEKEH